MDRTTSNGSSRTRSFFGGLPETGIWTPLGLGRGQFSAILGLSILLFVFVDGPVWLHLRASHFLRITVSYGVIPLGVAAALAWNRRTSALLVLAASAVIALIKLVVTAGLLVAFALARG